MPIVDSTPLEGSAPKEPHLALVTSIDASRIQATAIPPGAVLYIVMNPGHADGVTPIVLTRVSLRNWHFRCGCGNQQCTKRMTAALKWEGHHPQASQRGQVASSKEP